MTKIPNKQPNPFSRFPKIDKRYSIQCPMCHNLFADYHYKVEVGYCDQRIVFDGVCPECMQRLGFAEPRKAVPIDVLKDMEDEIERLQSLVDMYERIVKEG